ncbi:MAG: hypothetical protein ACYDB7_02300, partial [Mycobacteriales bacterium]
MRTRAIARASGAAALAAAATLVGTTALAGLASPASAAAPARTGWWNTASGNGAAAPAPTTPTGDLHVAVAPGQVLAFSAVAYQVFSPGSATVTLQIDASTEQGTPSLLACPTTTANWKGGGDQPASSAPGYDCSVHSYAGVISASGTSVSFFVDSRAEVASGLYSLAIVPATTNNVPVVDVSGPADTTTPFSVDFADPGTASFTGAAASPPPGPGAVAIASQAPAPASAASQPAQTAAMPSAPVPVAAIPVVGLPAPALPQTGGVAAAAPAPVVALPSGNPAPAARALAASPTSSNRLRDAAL